ncbi:MAG TPA: hypothetical protein VKV40_02135 [Ktedonobacteraceae bacterium]|nr:hypothetical protein [Ktedonobacteraceae bacterium]
METIIYIFSGSIVLIGLVLSVWFISSADRRARQLLREVLTQEEYRQLIQQGYIDIPSPGYPQRVYRVPHTPGFVDVIENKKLQERLCLQPLDRVPNADFVVIHKLMIEADEETYLQKANWIMPVMFSR